ncbi:hypothetical protein LCGC14_0878510 [marine sediment metagenome]|uniref:Uncharacterized protein n=1 Tax=marine sediment metagenome TaxID=412755 RepID=A0A0F9P2J6_9ZZZZ|nr:hypothetical protein [Phycisphaerae bacterium]
MTQVDFDNLRAEPYELGAIVTVSLYNGEEMTGQIVCASPMLPARDRDGFYFVEHRNATYAGHTMVARAHESQLTPVAGNGGTDEQRR